jgi:uncharacterized RDD family membrane protein YckC
MTTQAGVPYAGIATRAVALAIDAALANGIVLVGGGVLALVGSLVSDVQLDTLGKVLATGAWLVVVCSYFVLFWSTTGQTPGMRLMQVEVQTTLGARPGVPRCIVRVIGLGLAIVPLFLGFVPVFFDARRRGLHDFLANTVVCYADADLRTDDVVAAQHPRRLARGSAAVEDARLLGDELLVVDAAGVVQHGQPLEVRQPRGL